MVPSLSVHVAAAGVAMLKSIAKQGRPEEHLFWSPSQVKEWVWPLTHFASRK